MEFTDIRTEFRVNYRDGMCLIVDTAQEALDYIKTAVLVTGHDRNDYSIQTRFVQATEWK